MAVTLNRQPDGAMRAWYRVKKFGTVRPAYESNSGRWAAMEVGRAAAVETVEREGHSPA